MTQTPLNAKPVYINVLPQFQPMFKAWIKFTDGKTGTFFSRETHFTQLQIIHRRDRLVLEYRKNYELLIRLVEVKYQGKVDLARIYCTDGNRLFREYRYGKLILNADPDMNFWTNEMPDALVPEKLIGGKQ